MDALQTGSIVFDSLPAYNTYGPHLWPISPYLLSDGSINNCFKVVYLREDGPSVPPYVPMCESPGFTMEETSIDGCDISAIEVAGQNP